MRGASVQRQRRAWRVTLESARLTPTSRVPVSGRSAARRPVAWALAAVLVASATALGCAGETTGAQQDGTVLTVETPSDGETVSSRELLIQGKAPAHAEVRRHIRFAPDDKVQADAEGRWEYRAKLKDGTNNFEFFLQQAKDVRVKLAVTYDPSAQAVRRATATPTTVPTRPPTRPLSPTSTPTPRQRAQVIDVVDGDTIRVDIDGVRVTVRYIGVDTPETVDPRTQAECFGAEAAARNRELVADKTVELERDVSETDRFGRLLRYVYVDGRMVNETLVREGYAVASTYPPDVRYQDRFLAAEREAREDQRGLWASCGGADTPLPTATRPPPPPAPTNPPPAGASCEPSYPDVCIPIGSADYDCQGGRGDGPNYIRGPIRVLPPDPHRLDADRDGIGCE